MSGTPTLIAGLGEIGGEFDALLLDQFGTLHDGRRIFPAARSCLARLRSAGKSVLVLSNSGKRAAVNVRRLEQLGLPAAAYDGLLSSGEVAWQGLNRRSEPPFDRLGRRCLLISRGNDRGIVDGIDLDCVPHPAMAEFIYLAGLDDDRCRPEAWQAVLAEAARRHLPMLCANPDLTMFGGDGLLPGPGSLARLYESQGGPVHYVGKPHAPMFAAALHALGGPQPVRVLVVGDSLDHDILGGNAAGMPTALITSGVHAPKLPASGRPDDLVAAVERLAAESGAAPRWLLTRFCWQRGDLEQS